MSFLGFVVAVKMDPEKVRAMIYWPTPISRKEVQHFLGFANFYRKFIQNFSSVAAPLHVLTSPKSTFQWSPKAETAFRKRNTYFSTPILMLPDPKRQLVVDIDASDVGIGAVLSQWSISDNKFHPCAFLLCKPLPSRREELQSW